MSIVFRYLSARDWGFFGLAVLTIVAQVYLDLRVPEFMSAITTLVETSGSTTGQVLAQGAGMLACALAGGLASVGTGYLVAHVGSSVAMRMRGAVFGSAMQFSQAEMDRFGVPSLITRCTNDVTQVQMFVTMGLHLFVRAPIVVVWALAKIAGKSPQLTLTTGVAAGALFVVVGVAITLVVPKTMRMQALIDDMNRVTREHLSGMRVQRAYGAQGFQRARFDAANQSLTSTQLFVNRAMAMLQPSILLVMNGLELAVYVVGAAVVSQTDVSGRLEAFSDVVVFSSYAMQVVAAFMMLMMITVMLPRVVVACRRVGEVVGTRPLVADGPSAMAAADGRGGARVEFRDVSFRYPGGDADVLHDVSFTAEPGQTVAIIGSTGSGKSTLLGLVARLYDPTGGAVLVDGQDTRGLTLRSLRDRMALVPQRSVLFAGTVRTNVVFGERGLAREGADAADPPVDEGRLALAMECSMASEFVSGLPDGMDSLVEQGGTNLSGGQRQRVAIARAVYRDPRLYLFDDSFSALDYSTDARVRASLRAHSAGATTVVVAQRIGTVRDADKIVVLDDGKVVGQGTHRELLRGCTAYREIAASQLSQEELAQEGVE